MSNDLINYDEMLAEMAKAATATERPSSSTISFRSGILAVNGEQVKGNKLDMIIIASTHSNLYYEEKFDQDNPTSPVCFAYSATGEDMAPHPASEKPQSETCAACPHNQWGSDPDGGKGKACKNGRRLAMLPADIKVDEVMTSEIAVASLPVTSIKGWGNYVNQLSATFNRPPLGIYTTLGIEPHLKHQYHVTFTPKGVVDISFLRQLIDRAKSQATVDLLEKVFDPNPEEGTRVKASGKKDKM